MRLVNIILAFPFFCFTSASEFSASDSQLVMSFSDSTVYSPQIHTQATLADLLTIENGVNIFYTYARELEMSRLFGDQSAKLTIMAPKNQAVMALSRKPHEGNNTPDAGGLIELSDEEFDKLSRKNVEGWVAAHIIPQSPIKLDDTPHQTLLDGKSIAFKKAYAGGAHDWENVLVEDGVRILHKREAINGVLYVIDGTIKNS